MSARDTHTASIAQDVFGGRLLGSARAEQMSSYARNTNCVSSGLRFDTTILTMFRAHAAGLCMVGHSDIRLLKSAAVCPVFAQRNPNITIASYPPWLVNHLTSPSTARKCFNSANVIDFTSPGGTAGLGGTCMASSRSAFLPQYATRR